MSLGTFLVEQAPVTHPTIAICQGDNLPAGIGHFHYCHFNTDSLLSSAIAILITMALAFWISARVSTGVPGKLQMVFELFVDYVRRLSAETVTEEDAARVMPLALTVGFYILIANWLEFLPLTGPIHPANSDFNQTLAMAVVVFVVVQAYSIRVQGLRGSLRRFTKPFEMNWVIRAIFVPLNIVEEFVKPVTLSLRLFGNIFAGVLMVYLLGQLFTWGFSMLGSLQNVFGAAAFVLLIAWKAFDVFLIGSLQAFIFMLLTIIYFGQAREGMEEHGHGAQAGHGATAGHGVQAGSGGKATAH